MSNEAKRKHIEEVLEDYIDVLLDNPGTSASAGYNVEAAQREVNELAAEVERLTARVKAVETVVNGLRLDLDDRDMHEDFAGWEIELFVKKAEAALAAKDGGE